MGGGTYETIMGVSLFFGIGYFGGGRGIIIPEARAYVQDEELENGVKAIFVQARGNTSQLDAIIPYTYPDIRQTFEKYLIQSARSLSPDNVVPREYNR